ncbi:transporter substrate-binding domain-containing protein [Paucibacter sp. R3-3]|uniref:Transporter substrate-binding domain-containing protein n=1 Tax=Roseateles agri TaxID=3098619 RepID=A0ABU5DLH8_9BURK|nr:transporter substrate-binding domain-containing protein [Paucibacter sp. R3-3]MDY0746535.1 transporter substrate-binding domain-containing protein [Paucibacter sp. R3-3]
MHESITSEPDADLRRRALVAAALAASALPSLAQTKSPPIRIGRTDYTSILVDIEERILTEAFRRFGSTCDFVRLPLLRLIEMANDGAVDADIGRISEVAQRFPNLIMVPTPNCRTEVAVYGAMPDFATRTRSSIAGMRIGIVRGVFVLDKYTQGMNLVVVQDHFALTNMLMERRIDAAVAIYLDTEIQLRKKAIPGLVRWPYYWAAEPLHVLVHKRHAELVPKLDGALAQMTKEGLTKRYYLEGLKSIGLEPLLPPEAAPA